MARTRCCRRPNRGAGATLTAVSTVATVTGDAGGGVFACAAGATRSPGRSLHAVFGIRCAPGAFTAGATVTTVAAVAGVSARDTAALAAVAALAAEVGRTDRAAAVAAVTTIAAIAEGARPAGRGAGAAGALDAGVATGAAVTTRAGVI